MAYRNETEALRARVEHLEQELAEVHAELARRQSRGSAGTGPTGLAATLVGGPMRIDMAQTLVGELGPEAHEPLVAALRAHFGTVGQVNVLGRTLTFVITHPSTGRRVEVMVTPIDGKTTVRVCERLGSLVGGLYGGVLGGVGGGGLGLVIVGALSLASPLAVPAAVAGWLGVSYLGTRALFKRQAEARRRELEQAFHQAVEVAARQLGASQRVRVESPEPDSVEVSADAVDADVESPAEA